MMIWQEKTATLYTHILAATPLNTLGGGGETCFFVTISLGRIVEPSPKIVINLPFISIQELAGSFATNKQNILFYI